MRLSIIIAVFLKELREMLRDRRSLLVMFGLPLVIYPLATIGIAKLGTNKQTQLQEATARVAIVNGADAPTLINLLRQNSSLLVMQVPDPKAALHDGSIDAALTIPPRCETDARAGNPVDVQIQIDQSKTESAFMESRLRRIVRDFAQAITRDWIESRGGPPQLVDPVRSVIHDVASADQRLGKLLSLMLPMLLLVTGMLGALFPALNATTTERELGTLETLLVSPARRTELLFAKGLLVFISGLLTAAINMLSMSVTLSWALTMIKPMGASTFTVSPQALALAYLAAVPALMCFTTLVLIVGLIARNFREANSFATPVMLLPMASIAVALWEPQATTGLLVTPVVSTTLIIHDVLTGQAAFRPFLLAFMSSSLYAGLMLSLAARLFSNEQLVNPSWEPLIMRGIGRRAARRRRLPAVDEALALFGVSLLLMIFLSKSLMSWGLLGIVAGTQVLFVAAPAVLFAIVGRYRWRDTFSFRPTTPRALAGGLLIGVGLMPVIQYLAGIQNWFWPDNNPDARANTEFLLNTVNQFPILAPLAIGLLAGICEELLYRGPIQTAVMHKAPKWIGLSFVAIIFAAAHFDIHNLALRAAIGLVFGWMVYRRGSIFPAMLAHAAYDLAALALASWEVRSKGIDAILNQSAPPQFPGAESLVLAFIGLAITTLGLTLFYPWNRPSAKLSVSLPAKDTDDPMSKT